MREHIKVYTGSLILINRLVQLLEEQNITSIIKNHRESGRLAGFGTTGDNVELHVYNSDIDKTEKILKDFEEGMKSNLSIS